MSISAAVRSATGPEAGVCVIAETTGLPIPLAKIVVTDDQDVNSAPAPGELRCLGAWLPAHRLAEGRDETGEDRRSRAGPALMHASSGSVPTRAGVDATLLQDRPGCRRGLTEQVGPVHNRKLAVPFKHHAEHRHHIPRPRYRPNRRSTSTAAPRQPDRLVTWTRPSRRGWPNCEHARRKASLSSPWRSSRWR